MSEASKTAVQKKPITAKEVLNWLLDHAMIIIIILLAIFVQIQRPAFFGPANLISLLQFTTARLPMALGVAGCIILAGTDLSGGHIAGLAGYLAAIMGIYTFPNQPVLALIICMLAGGVIGLVNGFCMGKFKLHPFIVTLATQQITYGMYLTISNSAQLAMPASYAANFATATLFQIQTGLNKNGDPVYDNKAVVEATAANTLAIASVDGSNCTMIGTIDPSDPALKQLKDSMKDKISFSGNILADAKTVKTIEKFNSVILVEKRGSSRADSISEEITKIKSLQKEVLGIILI